MTSPSTSVVIATRDRPLMVREAIDAVLAQDYDGRVEVVVVADQSEPDESLVRLGGDRSVRVVRNDRTPGLAGARNTGISASPSEFVAFCDDDDYWLPGKLRSQVDALLARPEAGLCTSGIRVEYDGDTFPRLLRRDVVSFEELLRNRHTELHPSTFVMRRSVLLERVGLVDEHVPGGFGEDYEFLLRCAKAHPIVNVPQPFVAVRWGKQSFFFRRWATMSDGLSWLLERYPEFESSPQGSARVRGQIAFAQASMGHRRAALRWAGQSLRRNPREPRAYLAAAVASRAVSPDRVMELLHRRGRGI
ncbi:MAG TPA: glycosyltransferase family A protein [Nocardioidaceae bacterium]|nr:glycosyltransferase family A protein [Nocardioidaceae bacterium]